MLSLLMGGRGGWSLRNSYQLWQQRFLTSGWVKKTDVNTGAQMTSFFLPSHSFLVPSPWDGAPHIQGWVSPPTQSSLGTLSQTCPEVCLLSDFKPSYSLRMESVLFLQHQVLLRAALLLLSKTKAGVFSPAHVATRALGVTRSLYVSGRLLKTSLIVGQRMLTFTS